MSCGEVISAVAPGSQIDVVAQGSLAAFENELGLMQVPS